MTREGCCDSWPKPCSYHEGYTDGYDAALVALEEAETLLGECLHRTRLALAALTLHDAGFSDARDEVGRILSATCKMLVESAAVDPDDDTVLRDCPAHGTRLLCTEDEGYPERLREQEEAGLIMWFCSEWGCQFSVPDQSERA